MLKSRPWWETDREVTTMWQIINKIPETKIVPIFTIVMALELGWILLMLASIFYDDFAV